jgi:hypothetical protein
LGKNDEIIYMEENNWKTEEKKCEELMKFEPIRNNLQVTQMLLDSFKEEITFKYRNDRIAKRNKGEANLNLKSERNKKGTL